jgi:hypothetical protein
MHTRPAVQTAIAHQTPHVPRTAQALHTTAHYCTLHTTHYTPHITHHTLHTAHCTAHSSCTPHTTHHSLALTTKHHTHTALRNTHYTLYTAHCTLYYTQCTIHCALCTAHFIAHYALHTKTLFTVQSRTNTLARPPTVADRNQHAAPTRARKLGKNCFP